jgi:hypothetical protein
VRQEPAGCGCRPLSAAWSSHCTRAHARTMGPAVENGFGLVRTSRPIPFAVVLNRAEPGQRRLTTVHEIEPALSALNFLECRAARGTRLHIADCTSEAADKMAEPIVGGENPRKSERSTKLARCSSSSRTNSLEAILSGAEPDRAGLGKISRVEPSNRRAAWGHAGGYHVSSPTSPFLSIIVLASLTTRRSPEPAEVSIKRLRQ